MTPCHQPSCSGGRLCRITGLAEMHNGGGGHCSCRSLRHCDVFYCYVVCICLLYSTVILKLWIIHFLKNMLKPGACITAQRGESLLVSLLLCAVGLHLSALLAFAQ